MTAQTLTEKFARRYARGVVPNALAAIDTVRRNTGRIAVLALLVSTPHQAWFLFGLSAPHGLLPVVVAAFFALLIPATIDLGIVTMLKVTQTVGIARRAKRRAMGVLVVLVAVSAVVNIVADGPAAIRLLTAFTAVVLAAVEWVASAIAPDFAALEATESAAAATAKQTAVKRTRSEAARLGWERKRQRQADELAAWADDASAPVSPAIV